MNRSFSEQISREHFVIRVQSINSDGVWGTHPYNDELISFFAISHIISIHQEVELDPNNPEHAAMIKEYEEKTGKKVESDLKMGKIHSAQKEDLLPVIDAESNTLEQNEENGDATFVNITSLENLAAQSKRTFDAQDFLGK
jgi:hypothetical protein